MLEVTPEWTTNKSMVTKDWPYPLPPPECQDAQREGWTCIVYDGTGFWCNECTLYADEYSVMLNEPDFETFEP